MMQESESALNTDIARNTARKNYHHSTFYKTYNFVYIPQILLLLIFLS